MKCVYDLTTQCHKECPEVECYNYDKVNESVIDNEEPLKMIKFEEKDKCHWEDGCRADFFKELTAPYDVKNMQEFIAVIKAEAIDEFYNRLSDNKNEINASNYPWNYIELVARKMTKQLKEGGKK